MADKMYMFVYGTLKKGFKNHHFIEGRSNYIGAGELDNYSIYDLGYFPGVKEYPGDCVVGEVYEVDGEVLMEVDMLESEGSLYIRKLEKVKINNKELIEACVYVFNGLVEDRKKLNKLWERRHRYVRTNQKL